MLTSTSLNREFKKHEHQMCAYVHSHKIRITCLSVLYLPTITNLWYLNQIFIQYFPPPLPPSIFYLFSVGSVVYCQTHMKKGINMKDKLLKKNHMKKTFSIANTPGVIPANCLYQQLSWYEYSCLFYFIFFAAKKASTKKDITTPE